MRHLPAPSHLAAALLAALAAYSADAQSASTTETQALDRVTINIGRGQLRSVQGLTKADFESAVAGLSPLATVSRLPGVNFQSADPLGNYEWSTRFTLRAFSQNQLGFTLDDVPLGDMSYGNLNGLHISRAVSSENVARAYLSQGTGALETASSSNLGGTLQFYSSMPLERFGFQAVQTLGSSSNRRTFLRLDTGSSPLGEFYLSYTRQNADKWKGEGEQRQEQWNLKYARQIGEHQVTAFVNTSKRREIDYQDVSLEMVRRLGYDWDNFYPDIQAALNASTTHCGNAGSNYDATCDDAYYAGAGLRDDTLGGVTLDARLSEQARLKTTGYWHHNDGSGLWYTPYSASPDGTPLSLRTTDYAIRRQGVVSVLDFDVGAHQIKASFWHERNDFEQARRFYAVSPTNVPSPYDFPSKPFLTQWQYAFSTTTDQFSLADTVALSRELTLGAGFKSLRARIDGQLEVGTGRPSGTITASKGFLPQAGLNLRLSKEDELFVGVSRNMRVYQGAATGTTPYATTDAGFAAIKGTLKPETSDNFEAGWRTQGRLYEGNVTAYLVNFKDRLLGVTQGAGIQGNPTVLSNVGGVRTYGLEAALSFRLAPGFSWYNSLSLSQSTYRDDVVSKDAGNKDIVVATRGKHVVDAPDTLFKSILGYDSGAMFGSLGLDYMSRRYYTYLNDGSVDGRTLLNLSAGYRSKSLGFVSEGSFTIGVSNLTNKKYISTVGSNGFSNDDPKGTAQTLLTGAPRQVFLSFSAKL
ncbi:TonB-dependent receptor [Mitsuaria sp. WAJ17]|uniref:TonB-dependent receptor n=1 Tax=Mitsuaria sp. WAJ17 TaxID=2761452 RepID=UPI001602FD47|nr:TonB-dependent receptor [Mitsuaria sp. WAJ17]MBB2487851.1 TonB-dependent receptor [Mitsuaria sp. WAJ17]